MYLPAEIERAAPDLVVSKERFARIKGIELVRIKRKQRDQTLCFSSRPFVLCGLPVRKPRGGELLFGQDRIVPIFLATLAIRRRARPFDSTPAAEMLETVEYSRERRSISMLEQWLRVVHVMWPSCPARIADRRNAPD